MEGELGILLRLNFDPVKKMVYCNRSFFIHIIYTAILICQVTYKKKSQELLFGTPDEKGGQNQFSLCSFVPCAA
jgi:hypothetical protein